MKEGVLSFCVIKHLADDICEVIVNEGVEIDDAMVDEYHAYLQRHFNRTIAILVNKKNTYTYTFSAQRRLATLSSIKAIAALVYRRSSEIATKALQEIKREQPWNLKIFYDRSEAIRWLGSQLRLQTDAALLSIR